MEKYNIGRKAVWGRCDRLGIPKVYVGRNTFFSKKAVDANTPEEMRDTYKMTHDAVRSFIHRHKIPSKVEYGVTYYSKQHIQALKTGYFEGRERYYSVEELQLYIELA